MIRILKQGPRQVARLLLIGFALAVFHPPESHAAPAGTRTLFGAPPTGVNRQPVNIHPAVCRIVAPGNGSISFGSGTLVAVTEKYGLVITNWHVVNESNGQLWVVFPDGFQSAGAVQKVDRDWDLAAIAVFRPNVEPVKLSQSAPQPGEMLTIAGYGSGNYRAVSGPCTQYVAPGLKFPYEMVELAATARQGDSGGPILNNRGELAGVLFGAGSGRTSGSYCGRVQWFLSSLQGVEGLPATQPMTVIAAVTPPRTAPATTAGSQEPPASIVEQPVRVHSAEMANAVITPPIEQATAASKPLAAVPSPGASAQTQSLSTATPRFARPPTDVVWTKPASQAAALASAQSQRSVPQQVSLGELLGATPGDQLKSILAGIGILAVLAKTIAWLTTSPPPKGKKARQAA